MSDRISLSSGLTASGMSRAPFVHPSVREPEVAGKVAHATNWRPRAIRGSLNSMAQENGDNTERRRYDTVALLSELKKERRNGLVLGVIGAVIGIALLVTYLAQSKDYNYTSPSQKRAVLQSPSPTPAPPNDAVAPPPEPAPPPPVAPPAPAFVKTVLTKKTALFIDGKPVTPGRGAPLEVLAGVREIKLKLGKKVATEKMTLSPGVTYELRFDPKKAKAILKEVK